MISLTTALVSVALGAVFYFLFKKDSKPGKFPPGPFPLPIVGNLHSFAKFPHKALVKWGEQYEKMCTIYFGGTRVVLLNDPTLVREAFNDPNFTGRPKDDGFSIIAGGSHGLISSLGQEWQDQRRFTLRHLRDFGFGKNVMEELIMEEVQELISTIKSNEDQPMSLSRRWNLIVFNSLWRIMSGKRHSHDDPELSNLFDGFNQLKEGAGITLLLVFLFPELPRRFPRLTGFNKFMKIINAQKDFLRRAVREHETNRPEDGQPRDFIDAYLKEIEETTDESSSFYKEQGMKSLMAVLMDLFIAGSDTTANTLVWAFLYLTKFPEVQRKIHEELDSVVGTSRPVSLADRPSLPYSEATLLETMRYSSITPFGLIHATMTDVSFHGYHFPKGTQVAGNSYYSHYHPKLWDSPKSFNPARFLTQDGKKVHRSENFLGFSSGKRQCLGETLARDELFLFTTNILQRFSVRLADDSVNVPTEPVPAGPPPEAHPYSLVFTDRF